MSESQDDLPSADATTQHPPDHGATAAPGAPAEAEVQTEAQPVGSETEVAAAPEEDAPVAHEVAEDGVAEVAGDATESEAATGAAAAAPERAPDGEEDDPGRSDIDDRQTLKRALEALIFVSDRVVSPLQLGRILKLQSAEVRALAAELAEDYGDRGIELVELSGGYQFRSAPACAKYVQSLVAQKPVRLTRAQLETLALVAYRQPITRPEVDEVRGVDTGSAVKVLLERGLIKMLGRKEEAGRPMLYGTTPFFLEFFGLKTLRDLPTLKEFTDLSEENRSLFKRKTGEEVEDARADLDEAAAQEAAPSGDVSETADAPDDTAADASAEVADTSEASDMTEVAAGAEHEADADAESDAAEDASESDAAGLKDGDASEPEDDQGEPQGGDGSEADETVT